VEVSVTVCFILAVYKISVHVTRVKMKIGEQNQQNSGHH